MIIPSQGLRLVLAVRPVDFCCGHDALAALVQNKLGLDPHSGLIVVFRSKRMDRLKILLWDGTGLVLVYKRLGEGGSYGCRSATAFYNSPGSSSKRCSTGCIGSASASGSSRRRPRRTDSFRGIGFNWRRACDRFAHMTQSFDSAAFRRASRRSARLVRSSARHARGRTHPRRSRAWRAEDELAARLHVESELAAFKETVERLQLLVKEYERARFGKCSEKFDPDQLQLSVTKETHAA